MAPRLAMDALDGVKGRDQGAPTEERPSNSAGAHHLLEGG